MGLKVDMTEVGNLKKAIDRSLDSVNEKVESLSGSMSKLVGTDGFEGEAATSVKNYTNTFHIKTIKNIEDINNNFKSDISKSIEKFRGEVDNSHSAILVEDKIKEYKKDIDDALKLVNKASYKANRAISNVSDLTTAKKIKTDTISSKMSEFNNHIDKTMNKLNDFDSNNSIDGDRTTNLIDELSGLSSYVKGLSSNRARISSTSQKVENSIARHKTSEELIKWQKLMENTSDNIYKTPGINQTTYETMKTAGQEYFALKAIGDGSAKKGFQEYMKTKDIDKLINNMDQKRLSKMATILNTDRGNIKIKNTLKHSGEFVKNNPFKGNNLVNWMTKVQEYDSQNAELLKQSLKDKNFNYTFGDSKKFFDSAEMKKAASTEFKNTFSNQNFRETFLKKENIKSKSAILKNIKKYWNDDIKGALKKFGKDFKNKNIIGKLGKLSKLGGKALKPLAAIAAITDNLNKKSMQEKLVGMGVDLSAIGASAAAGAAIGTAIPLPIVGTLIGAGVGALVGGLLDKKFTGMKKSATETAKDGINHGINKVKDKAPKVWNNVTSGFKNAFS
ncbi:transposase [Mammaliicoccus vitulinus]|uniref:Transposase n=1 Tax=Mammaliicoccus vitulinus TaxID=71237 RepID=A0A2T4PQT3_9STAP|nr:T7SS effector LXG polymorphic toxin [Mammaliicoccus vitulinus]PTI28147.1 transposase [Mammaliicoccus vitulinus]